MNIFDDTRAFLDKMGLECEPKPNLHIFMQQRIDHLREELEELQKALDEGNLEEVIDANIDLIYIASGNLNLCGADGQEHWDAVQQANMKKKRGTTKRGHSFDAIKPPGWQGPDHAKILEKTASRCLLFKKNVL